MLRLTRIVDIGGARSDAFAPLVRLVAIAKDQDLCAIAVRTFGVVEPAIQADERHHLTPVRKHARQRALATRQQRQLSGPRDGLNHMTTRTSFSTALP